MSTSWLILFLKEVEAINSIRRDLDRLYTKRKTIVELENDLIIIDLITACYDNLDIEREALTQLKANPKLTIFKTVISALIGIIYFSAAFLTGQIVALAVAGLFFVGTASLAWPIVLVSLIVGLSALAVYWFVERPSIEKLISSLFGFDQDKIDEFCNPEKVHREKMKLEELKTNITICKESMQTNLIENSELEGAMQEAKQELEALKLSYPRLEKTDNNPTKLSMYKSQNELSPVQQQNNFFNAKLSRPTSINNNQLSSVFLNI